MAETAALRVVARRYQLGELIGRGAMGSVWTAQDTRLGRTVAVKEIRAHIGLAAEDWDQKLERALLEAKAAAIVRHQNVVVVHDVVMDEDKPWIIMEMVSGRSLAEELATGRMTVPDAARIAREALDGLIAAHASDVVHRDVKPSNLLLARPDGRTVLTDFGIASIAGAGPLTATGAMIGTLEYLSPERAKGFRATPASDLWSLGATLYEMVEGRSPFRRNNEFATLQAVLEGAYDPPRNAGPLAEVIDGLLTKDPSCRITARDARSLLIAAESAAAPPGAPMTGSRDQSDPAADDAQPCQSRPLTDSGSGNRAASTALLTDVPAPTAPRAAEVPRSSGSPVRRRWLTLAFSGVTVAALFVLGVTAVIPIPDRFGAEPGPATATLTRPGFTAVSNPAGFTMEIGTDWTGPYSDKSRIFYYSADRKYRLGVHMDPRDGKGNPYAELMAQDSGGDGTTSSAAYPGYRRVRLEQTRHSGGPAAVWEFTWKDPTTGVRQRSIDLRYTKDGRTYDFWVAGPDKSTHAIRKYFDATRDTFSPTR
jgi:serine/threonine protein kinase